MSLHIVKLEILSTRASKVMLRIAVTIMYTTVTILKQERNQKVVQGETVMKMETQRPRLL